LAEPEHFFSDGVCASKKATDEGEDLVPTLGKPPEIAKGEKDGKDQNGLSPGAVAGVALLTLGTIGATAVGNEIVRMIEYDKAIKFVQSGSQLASEASQEANKLASTVEPAINEPKVATMGAEAKAKVAENVAALEEKIKAFNRPFRHKVLDYMNGNAGVPVRSPDRRINERGVQLLRQGSMRVLVGSLLVAIAGATIAIMSLTQTQTRDQAILDAFSKAALEIVTNIHRLENAKYCSMGLVSSSGCR
jgi:hypothetical protein